MQKIKIAIVDDHPIVLQGFKQLLSENENTEIIGAFEEGAGILLFLKNNLVDVVLIDIELPDINGVVLCKEIKEKHPEMVVLMVSNRSERSVILEAIKNGASGYLLKNASMNELLQCITQAMNGNIVFSKEVKEIISKPSARDLDEVPKLTKREKEILRLLIEGKTSNKIADELFLSPFTVDTHRKNILHKFKAKNVAELVSKAHQLPL
ncbi:response regulator transcription factor [Flavobacterium sp. xlx-214]|uniref:response regulator n=1 Tax=unclassified Flavobacterium TaxID=196869 RepID=UPI0013D7D415|nr:MULTISPECIES: response regulator transcription factor [unclassified Flavobacterium]MBA5792761.1 response regulator transcription factor [Flavobacterium sp. xlx-221]QMI83898.1 response regulator transcription factor [Flavobacterium sp. xlx-214]